MARGGYVSGISRRELRGRTLANMQQHARTKPLEPLLTIADIRTVLRVSRTGVYRLVDRGDLVPVRVGRRMRFHPRDVRGYLERARDESELGVPDPEGGS